MAVVSQRSYLFSDTILGNLALANPDANPANIVQAAQQAHIHGFVESLPQGYGTWIGQQGVTLSGGQQQRLVIARALLRDAPILILDEPTANLDALTEREIMAELQPLMAGRTTIMITHRLVGLESVDEILVLDAGRVVERGTFPDLMQLGGEFRQMWDLQQQALAFT
jgi:ABC-type multidrug transport system fused ATPase/permease subunit